MNIAIIICTFLLMEGITWLIHKYIMHGFLWTLHRDHHSHAHEGDLERNDLFFIIFALPTITLLYFGVEQGFSAIFYVGLGIFFYGMAYFFVHDIFIHQRIRWMKNTKSPYFRAIRRAHKQHHKHTCKEHGECFGFLWVPWKYFRMYFNKS